MKGQDLPTELKQSLKDIQDRYAPLHELAFKWKVDGIDIGLEQQAHKARQVYNGQQAKIRAENHKERLKQQEIKIQQAKMQSAAAKETEKVERVKKATVLEASLAKGRKELN